MASCMRRRVTSSGYENDCATAPANPPLSSFAGMLSTKPPTTTAARRSTALISVITYMETPPSHPCSCHSCDTSTPAHTSCTQTSPSRSSRTRSRRTAPCRTASARSPGTAPGRRPRCATSTWRRAQCRCTDARRPPGRRAAPGLCPADR